MDARIRREHQKLHGLSQELATEKFLEEVSQLELYGVELHHVTDSDLVEKIIGVGPEDIHIYSSNMDLLNRYVLTIEACKGTHISGMASIRKLKRPLNIYLYIIFGRVEWACYSLCQSFWMKIRNCQCRQTLCFVNYILYTPHLIHTNSSFTSLPSPQVAIAMLYPPKCFVPSKVCVGKPAVKLDACGFCCILFTTNTYKSMKIRILNLSPYSRYSYTAVQYTAFHGKKFTAMLTSTEHGGNDRLELDLKTRSAAQALYRGITEFHTFFRRDSVSRVVKTAGYCKSILGNLKGQNPDRFYFDIVRTHKEVVDNVWTILHPATPTTNAPPVNSPPLSHPAARSQSTQSHVHHRPAVSRHRQALPPLPPYSQRSRSVDVVAGPNRLCVAPLGGRTDTPESEENSYVPGGSDTYVMIRRGSDRPGCGVGSDSVSSTSEDQYINSASDTYVNYSSDTYITSEGSECSGASMASMDHRTTSPPPIYTEIDLEHSTSQETGGAPNSAMISLSSPTHQPSSQDAAAALSRAQQLESELQRLRNAMTCRSCKDKPIGAIFCPCGHTVCCYECAQHLRECIQCHRQVDSIQRVLLA